LDHLQGLGANAQNTFATDVNYAKQRAHAEAQYAVNTSRPPLTAELMQALDSLYSVASETHQLLANKHSHLFGHVPSAPGELSAGHSGQIGAPQAPDTYEVALSNRLRGLLSVLQDGLAIAQSFNSRL
jgi:hypothetical protein